MEKHKTEELQTPIGEKKTNQKKKVTFPGRILKKPTDGL